ERALRLRRAHHEQRAEDRQREDQRENERARHYCAPPVGCSGDGTAAGGSGKLTVRVTVTVSRSIGSSIQSVTTEPTSPARTLTSVPSIGLPLASRSGWPSPLRSQRRRALLPPSPAPGSAWSSTIPLLRR